jgi:hypothetical protein
VQGVQGVYPHPQETKFCKQHIIKFYGFVSTPFLAIFTTMLVSMRQKKSCAALFFSLVVFCLMIGCLSLPWFYFSRAFSQTITTISATTLNSTSVVYDLFGTRTHSLAFDRVINTTQTCASFQQNALVPVDTYESMQSNAILSPRVASIFKLCQAFAIIASVSSIALCVVSGLFLLDPIRNATIRTLGIAFSRTFPLSLGLVLITSIVIALFGFLGVSSAFSKDQANCDSGPCKSFSGSATSEQYAGGIVSEMSWGPEAGWYMVLAAAPTSLLVFFFVVSNRPSLSNAHTHAESEDHDMQPMVEPATEVHISTSVPIPFLPLDRRARSVLLFSAACTALAIAAIVTACLRPPPTPPAQHQPPQSHNLEGVIEGIEMQVLPPPPVSWPSLKEGLKFYERFLASLAAEARAEKGGLDFDFDAKARKERSVVRQLWQLQPSCTSSNCSTPAPLPIALVRRRQVVSGSGNGTVDVTLKQKRRFRQTAAALPACAIATGHAICKAKMEANYWWKAAEGSDVDVTWERSCTLQLIHASAPLVVRSVRDVLPFFSSALAAFGTESDDASLYERLDCYHEREYKVRVQAGFTQEHRRL